MFGVINKVSIDYFNNDNASILIGGMLGLLFSLIGRYKYNLPIYLFGYNEQNQKYVHMVAILLYSLIFRIIVTPLQNYIVN